MKLITDISDFKSKASAVAIGKFDGLHAGHMELINRLQNEKAGLDRTIFSFYPTPFSFFKKEEFQILSRDERIYLLKEMGIENLIEIPFDESIAYLEPEDFVSKILIDNLNMKLLIVGTDYRFGSNRRGDIHMLKELSNSLGFKLTVVPDVLVEGEVVHSSVIRRYIQNGDFEKTEKMLGRPYYIKGRIEHGKMLGRKLGFPTVNITVPPEKLTPPNGVYVTICEYKNKKMRAVSNIGNNPTVDKNQNLKKCETNIFNFNEDIYGEDVVVKFYSFIRPEQKFESVEALKIQISKDVTTAHKFWECNVYN